MSRFLSHFTSGGRFALLLMANLIVAAKSPAQELPRERMGPTLVMPANGSVVDHSFIVRIGFAGAGPHAPPDGTGILMNAPPLPPPDDLRGPEGEGQDIGPSEGTGLAPEGEHRRRGPHFVLLVDAPPLEPGTLFQADAQHIAFPRGIPQMTLSLPSGTHRLVLQVLDHEGFVRPRKLADPLTVTVR